MPTDHILQLIDTQIAHLQEARAVLVGIGNTSQEPSKRRGRPKGSGKRAVEVSAPLANKRAKRTMSAEGKARVAAAQKARWAAQKKTEKPANPVAKKIATRPKPAKKKGAPVKKATPPETQATTETTAAEA